jgi:hypothetical protein
VKKGGEYNQKVGKVGRVISQMLTPRPKHDKIRAQWVSNMKLESMLKRV